MKKLLSFIIVVMLMMSVVAVAKDAKTENEVITVYLSLSDNGKFVTSPVTNEKMVEIPIEISYFDLAEYGLESYYRFEADSFENGGGYISETVVEKPTLMHLFIRVTEKYYLDDIYCPDEDGEILKFTGEATAAYAEKFFGHDSNFTYLVNGEMPEMSEGWGASCDYILLEDGMTIDIGMFSSWEWASSGSVASFAEKEITAFAEGSVNFSVKGNPLFYGGNDAVDLDEESIYLVKSGKLDWNCDEQAEYIFEADENGLFNVRFDRTGEYFVFAVDVNADSEAAKIAPAVCRVEVVESEPLPDYTGYWTSFRGNENNMGVVDANIPRSERRATLKWAEKFSESWMDASTPPIIVEDRLYFVLNNRLLCVDSDDGSLIDESEELDGNIGFGTTSITYGGGMFYVPLGNGRIQALRADTLESVWISEPLGGQTITPVSYRDGKIFCGTWNGESAPGYYFCIDVDDEDKNQKTEIKKCLWTVENEGGFYWAGAYVTDGYAVFGGDDGEAEGMNGESVLYSVDIGSGEIIDVIEALSGDIRSTIAYDEETEKLFFTTKGGYLCSVRMNEDGSFDDESFGCIELGGASTVTPLVYDGLAYIGVTNSSQFENGGSGYKIIDVNAQPMTEVASIETPGSVQSSGLLTNAYEKSGKICVYITYNNIPGGIFELIAEKSDETNADGSAIVEVSATEVFVPEEDMAQYCICSPICDENGVIYYKNDSGYLMAVKRKNVSVGSYGGGTMVSGGKENEDADLVETSGGNDKNDVKEDIDKNKIEEKPEVEEETKEVLKPVSFDDIKGHWAENFVVSLCQKGIIKGKTEKTFAPEDNMTRAEFLTILHRLSGENAKGETSFDDLDEDDWYYEAVLWAVGKEITNGVTERLFLPDSVITREMAVVFVFRYIKNCGIEIDEEGNIGFDDEDEISLWARTAVSFAEKQGILSGRGKNCFEPTGTLTRAEATKIIEKMIGVIENDESER